MGFDVYNPRVSEAIERAVFQFCEATLRTAIMEAEEAYAALRPQLKEGHEGGETYRELSRRVQGIFDDPKRAGRIAITESSRAVHAGQMELARETGIVGGKRWLASGDACDLCLKLAAMGTIDLDAPFHVHSTGAAAYRVVMHPPLHPNCFCTTTEIVDYAAVNAGAADLDILRFRARPPSRINREPVMPPMAASFVPPWVK